MRIASTPLAAARRKPSCEDSRPMGRAYREVGQSPPSKSGCFLTTLGWDGLVERAGFRNSSTMGLLDPALRKATRLGLGLAGSLIGEVQRRGTPGSRRTPDRLLLEDASGMPGPALVGPVADFDMVLLPDEIDGMQAKELAVAAGKVTLHGAARRLLSLAEALRRRDPAEEEIDDDSMSAPISATESAERVAWERFVVALEKLTALQAAYALDPDDLAAEQVRWAEVDLEDAVAVAGEFEVKKIRWLLA
jgi:hypothetical protein